MQICISDSAEGLTHCKRIFGDHFRMTQAAIGELIERARIVILGKVKLVWMTLTTSP